MLASCLNAALLLVLIVFLSPPFMCGFCWLVYLSFSLWERFFPSIFAILDPESRPGSSTTKDIAPGRIPGRP